MKICVNPFEVKSTEALQAYTLKHGYDFHCFTQRGTQHRHPHPRALLHVSWSADHSTMHPIAMKFGSVAVVALMAIAIKIVETTAAGNPLALRSRLLEARDEGGQH